LVPWVWLRNRITDQGTPEPGDVKVPRWIRRALGVSGALLFILATAAFIIPQLAIQTWPWKLSPLGGRVVSGWAAFVAIGELAMARESRWSAWKTPLESIALWYALIVLGAALNPQDFSGQPFVNWYILGTMAILLSIFALYIAMEARRRVLPVNT
jgi:hypothetical protein